MKTLQPQTLDALQMRPNKLSTRPYSLCSRCQGLLVKTFCISPKEGIAEFQIPAMKCLQCGDLFDSTILENRWRSQQY